MEAIFYSRNAGARLVEDVYSGATSKAENFQVVLFEYIKFHMTVERLKELLPQLDEQTKVVETLRKELRAAEEKKVLKTERVAIQEKYVTERSALDELTRCVSILQGVKKPEFPAWLTDFLLDAVS